MKIQTTALVTRICLQESDCSLNWCELENSDKENDAENESIGKVSRI